MTHAAWTRRGILAGLGAWPLAGVAGNAGFGAVVDAARQLPPLQSIVIAQGGQIAAAEAIRGPSLETPVNVKSVSKSLISALTGIALARGEVESLDTKVAPLIGRQVPRRADPRVKDITVRHMLAMQSGLQEVSGAAYGAWVESKFWIYDALSKPMVAEPGSAMLYSTASYHVLGAVLTAVSGQDLHTLADQRLAVPLGIALPPWTKDPQGRYLGGNDMRMSPLAMMRFGEMYRLGGTALGRQILTPDWIADSWTAYGASRETGHGYGFGWFLWDVSGVRVAYARGYAGQMIFVVPERALTVAITSSLAKPARLDGHLGDLFRLLTDHVLPAA